MQGLRGVLPAFVQLLANWQSAAVMHKTTRVLQLISRYFHLPICVDILRFSSELAFVTILECASLERLEPRPPESPAERLVLVMQRCMDLCLETMLLRRHCCAFETELIRSKLALCDKVCP